MCVYIQNLILNLGGGRGGAEEGVFFVLFIGNFGFSYRWED